MPIGAPRSPTSQTQLLQSLVADECRRTGHCIVVALKVGQLVGVGVGEIGYNGLGVLVSRVAEDLAMKIPWLV